jgi:hypothetical protein
VSDQIPTVAITTEEIMRHANFQKGLDDARSGRPPRFDQNDDLNWSYERGRLFAYIAPTNIPLFLHGRYLNPTALALYRAACERSLIL